MKITGNSTEIVNDSKFNQVLDKIVTALGKANAVQIGWPVNSTYPDGTSVPMVAALMEFGAPRANIPPRPYFRDTIQAKSPAWPKAIADLLIANKYDSQKTLEQIGIAVKGQLQQSIVDFDRVPLKPETIARKGFAKQLVDTGQMLKSVDYKVI